MKMPTKEQVLEASENCPDAKEVLEKLFPEAFKEEWIETGSVIKAQLWTATGRDRYCIAFVHRNRSIGYLSADGNLWGLDDDYKIEKDDSGGEYALKFYKKK